MRDDILSLFEEEERLLSEKKSLFDRFMLSEIEKISCLNYGRIEKCLSMFDADNDLIAEIDSLDFHIKKIEQQIAGTIGVKPSEIGKFLSARKETVIKKVCSSKREIRVSASELAGMREKTIGLLESALGKTAAEIDGLQSLRKIKSSGILKKKL
ncbi:MAG TPA: hypothetical protein P5346_17620 [Spirochaetota bacterium]|nr:hypothetical protein [Spirochaetota bacterium]